METTQLRDAYDRLLAAADTVASADHVPHPPEGEWNADQVLAHVTIVSAVTITAASEIASGANTTYENRRAQDLWTLARVITRAGGSEGLCRRIRHQSAALCSLTQSLGDAELDTTVPTLLLSHGALAVDQPVALRDLIAGVAAQEIPGHTQQLLDLLPAAVPA